MKLLKQESVAIEVLVLVHIGVTKTAVGLLFSTPCWPSLTVGHEFGIFMFENARFWLQVVLNVINST